MADRRVGIFPHGQGRVVWTAVAAGDLAQLTSFRPRCQLRRDRASPQRDGSGRSASSPAPARADPKTVVLHTPAGYRFAVLAASDRLDLHKAADALGVRRHDVRLATEADMAADFSRYEVGAIPPIGLTRRWSWSTRDCSTTPTCCVRRAITSIRCWLIRWTSFVSRARDRWTYARTRLVFGAGNFERARPGSRAAVAGPACFSMGTFRGTG